MTGKTYAKLTSKGRITIPADWRKHWNLKAGDKIAFEDVTDDQATIRPERGQKAKEAAPSKLPARRKVTEKT